MVPKPTLKILHMLLLTSHNPQAQTWSISIWYMVLSNNTACAITYEMVNTQSSILMITLMEKNSWHYNLSMSMLPEKLGLCIHFHMLLFESLLYQNKTLNIFFVFMQWFCSEKCLGRIQLQEDGEENYCIYDWWGHSFWGTYTLYAC